MTPALLLSARMELIQSFVNVSQVFEFYSAAPSEIYEIISKWTITFNEKQLIGRIDDGHISQFINFIYHFLDVNFSHSPASFTCFLSWLTLAPSIFIMSSYFSESFDKFRFCGTAS